MTLALQDDRGASDQLGVTLNHPFWKRGRGWVPAGSLAPDDVVWSLERGWLRVAGVQLRAALAVVFNLEIEGDHTYAVGHFGAWVHNDCYRQRFQGWLKDKGFKELPSE